MEYGQIIRELNKLFAHTDMEAVDIAAQANHLLSLFSINDVPRYIGDISDQAVAGLYSVLGDLRIPDEAKEHLIFRYYMLLIQATGEGEADHIVEQVMTDYEKLSFLALESMVIHLLKEDKISEGKFEELQRTFKSTVVEKELFSSSVRGKLRRNVMLSQEDVTRLCAYEKFKIIEAALDSNLVAHDALTLLQPPQEGEKNRKMKLSLSIKASRMDKMNRKYSFPAIFSYDDDGISIEFPDLPGCYSCAYSTEQALNMAKEALELYLEGMDVKDIPVASSLDSVGHQKDRQKLYLIEVETK